GGGVDNGGAAEARGGMPGRLQVGQTQRLRQTDDRLIVTEENPGGPVMSSYSFDGKETTNANGPMTSKSKTKWDGVALVTDSTSTIDTGRDAAGAGGQGRGGAGRGGRVSIKAREV